LQQENQNDCDYTIFSSWIGAFVSGAANEGQAEGTIEEHIKAAVSVGANPLRKVSGRDARNTISLTIMDSAPLRRES